MKTELKYEEVVSDTWRNKKDEGLDYVKKDVICTAFSYVF